MMLTFPHLYKDLHEMIKHNIVVARVLSEKLISAHLIRQSLLNLKAYYHVRKRLPLQSILSQMNSIYFFKVHFNIIYSLTSFSPNWSLSLWFSLLFHMCHPILITFLSLIMNSVNGNIYETPDPVSLVS